MLVKNRKAEIFRTEAFKDSIKISFHLVIGFFIGLLVLSCQESYLNLKKGKLSDDSITKAKLSSIQAELPIKAEIPIKTELPVETDITKGKKSPKYWFHEMKNDFSRFEEVGMVLDRMGLQRVAINYTNNITNYVSMDWDLAWSYMSIEHIPIDWNQLNFNQRVNHIPGMCALLCKSQLSTKIPSVHIPRGFISKQKLQDYATANPKVRFLQKNRDNRGISLKNVSEINIASYGASAGTFAQVYVEDPFLIEGHKFDMSFYVLITSMDPLRVYMFTKEVVFRICPLPYDANDVKNMDRHIISPTQLDNFNFPPIKKYTDHGFSIKHAFEIYFADKGFDSTKIFEQAEHIIRELILERESLVIDKVKNYKSKFSFFELIRVDMMLDKNQKLHVIEMNQHPTLHAYARLIKYKSVFENLLFNVFNIVGAGTTWIKNKLYFDSLQEELMVVGKSGLHIKPEVCANHPCNETCSAECDLCVHCLNSIKKYDLMLAYKEALHVGAFKRIFPSPNDSYAHLGEDYLNNLNAANKLHSQWFIEMCKRNKQFC